MFITKSMKIAAFTFACISTSCAVEATSDNNCCKTIAALLSKLICCPRDLQNKPQNQPPLTVTSVVIPLKPGSSHISERFPDLSPLPPLAFSTFSMSDLDEQKSMYNMEPAETVSLQSDYPDHACMGKPVQNNEETMSLTDERI